MVWKHFMSTGNKYTQANGFNIRLSFLFVDSDVYNLQSRINYMYDKSEMTYLKQSSHNLRLDTYIQKITSSRGINYKIRKKIHKQKTTK